MIVVRLLSVLALIAVAISPAEARVTQYQLTLSDGTNVDFKVLVPDAFDNGDPLPAILAFPGGRQTIDRLDTALERFWEAEAEKRGYLVILPAAPEGQLFFREGEKIFPEFLDEMLKAHDVKGGKFHLTGISNGGRSAFHIAAKYPQYFTSILALPGFLPQPTPEKYAALKDLCVVMIAGEIDLRWIEAEKKAAHGLSEAGGNPERLVSPGDGHLPLAGYSGEHAGRLFDLIEAKTGC